MSLESRWNYSISHELLQNSVEILYFCLIHPAKLVEMVILSSLLVQPPFHLPQVRLEIVPRLLQLPHQPLQLRLGQVVPVKGEWIRQRLHLLILDLELHLQSKKCDNKFSKFPPKFVSQNMLGKILGKILKLVPLG